MPIYARQVDSSNEVFRDRETIIATSEEVTRLPVPDNVTLCNGCNHNIGQGYLVYLGKRELKANRPYDYYCKDCLEMYFPKYILVSDKLE